MDRQVDNPEGERMARRVMLALCAAVLVPGVAACGGSTEGAATTSTSAAQAALWNPCTEVPDDLLRQLSVDPGTEESGVAGVPQSGWEICKWSGQKYFLTVYSTGRTLQEVRDKPGNIELSDVRIGTRSGTEYRVEGASKDRNCDIVFSAQQGAVSLRIGNRLSDANPQDPCGLARQAAEVLAPIFPS
ncbi:DUF3558 domain-containing protein [Nocardia sp. bgisy118]|uniref:DUF3558 domain-containing protein n=1 Tax=Nocardia sp. bgisy118 TaxID=3413786 RepID=UPI003F4A121F